MEEGAASERTYPAGMREAIESGMTIGKLKEMVEKLDNLLYVMVDETNPARLCVFRENRWLDRQVVMYLDLQKGVREKPVRTTRFQ